MAGHRRCGQRAESQHGGTSGDHWNAAQHGWLPMGECPAENNLYYRLAIWREMTHCPVRAGIGTGLRTSSGGLIAIQNLLHIVDDVVVFLPGARLGLSLH
jgi:hypothetical protein